MLRCMLRDATGDDLNFVHGLYMHDTINPFIAYDPMPVGEFAPIYLDLLEQVQFLIYEEDGEARGMAQIQWGTHRFVHSAQLGGIAIVPPLQNQGVGTRMMKELLNILGKKRIVRVELCVSADNPRGVAFYEKFGFRHEGTMAQYFSRSGRKEFFDEHMMALFLA